MPRFCTVLCAIVLLLLAGWGSPVRAERCEGDKPVSFCADFAGSLLTTAARKRICERVLLGRFVAPKVCPQTVANWICRISVADNTRMNLQIAPQPRFCKRAEDWCLEHNGLWEGDNCD